MPLRLPAIYPITDTRISGLSHAEQVEQLIDGGATLIQLREKTASPDEFYKSAKDAVDIAHEHGVKIIINDRVDIAMAVGADGLHLGQDDLPPSEARKLLGDAAIIGISTHHLIQAIAAKNEPVDYIAIGPIFSTLTKHDPDPVVGLERLREICSNIPGFPLVAIGGIDETNFRDVLAAGAHSAAMISAVLRPSNSIAANYQHQSSLADKNVQHF